MPSRALFASGTFNEVFVEAAFAWSPSGTEPRLLSFVNCSETQDGGSHLEGLVSALEVVPPSAGGKERLLRGLVAVVHVGLSHPRFGGSLRTRLQFDGARLAVHEVVTRAINGAPWWWDRLHEMIG